MKKVPVFFFFTGDHPDYHRPTDTADRINIAGMRRVADLVQDLVAALAELPKPEYVRVVEPRSAGEADRHVDIAGRTQRSSRCRTEDVGEAHTGSKPALQVNPPLAPPQCNSLI